jgi:hypothetical protein
MRLLLDEIFTDREIDALLRRLHDARSRGPSGTPQPQP